ncbi:Serine/threonine-protein phosphatase PP1-gamma catalytic subunit [Toxocara canis]|uniref:Serine/threonine-protein phosphatase n=1 Tax=Toxocara canis TaxID=6265 RepID=A0A0B2W3X4_TOXCA|nr:Serine/threonine-protein phosphatase PP1-gamma catalytic subunit [Toxocara canis]
MATKSKKQLITHDECIKPSGSLRLALTQSSHSSVHYGVIESSSLLPLSDIDPSLSALNEHGSLRHAGSSVRVGDIRLGKSKESEQKPWLEELPPDQLLEHMNYAEFLDRHYQNVQPGVHRIKYALIELSTLIRDASTVLQTENTLIEIRPPITICGDLHGQFNDLVNIFLLIGQPPWKRYLFLGDYVDRGGMQLECICLLLAYKVLYPDRIYLLRGNHECARVNKRYGFYDDCIRVFQHPNGINIWEKFQRLFNLLPVAALIEGKIFCMHGGLSPSMRSFQDIRNAIKPLRNPSKGLITDLLWADPDPDILNWHVSSRGSGFYFGEHVIAETCATLGVDLVIRAHQMCLGGFCAFPSKKLITIFSAPSYSNNFYNASSVMHVDEHLNCRLNAFVPKKPDSVERVQTKQQLWELEVEAQGIGDMSQFGSSEPPITKL